jgi:DNA-binding IclR family transcriptional regulator
VTDDRDIAGFVREHISSVWALELLLILLRGNARAWTVAQLVTELRGSPSLVVDNLARFERSGLVVRAEGDGWRFAPANALMATLVEDLAAAYRERPVSIINIIARPDPIQGLADAFKLKGGN